MHSVCFKVVADAQAYGYIHSIYSIHDSNSSMCTSQFTTIYLIHGSHPMTCIFPTTYTMWRFTSSNTQTPVLILDVQLATGRYNVTESRGARDGLVRQHRLID